MPETVDLIGLGELLWDCFPDERRPGGAPANVAFHARQLGLSAAVATRVGTDPLGNELLAYLESKGLSTELAQRDPEHATGTVTVKLENGSASYAFLDNCAWDFLLADDAWLKACSQTQAVCFGTLAQRQPISRESIHRCVSAVPEGSLRVYDVNLRAPFYDRLTVEASLRLANIVKLNDEEVRVLREMFDVPADDEFAFGAWLLRNFELDLVCITRGDQGAAAIAPDHVCQAPGIAVDVVDTVGAGDAFTAALIWSRLQRTPIDRGLAFANRVGALVASRPGAMPDVAQIMRG